MSVDSGGDFGVFVDIYSEAAGRTVGTPGVNAEGQAGSGPWVLVFGSGGRPESRRCSDR